MKLCDAAESNRAEIGPIEFTTKQSGKSKKGVPVCWVTLDRVTLGVVSHVQSYYIIASACAVSCMVGCCTGLAAACAVLYMVGYYATVTVQIMLCIRWGMLSQFGYCI